MGPMKSLLGMGFLAWCAACSSGSADGGDTAPSTILDDPQVPACDQSKNYRLQGKLAGQDIAISQSQFNDLEPKELQIIEPVNDMVQTDIRLTWSAPLVADQVIPLTGASLRIPNDQPLAGQSFCLTIGELGAPTPSDPSQGRTVHFSLYGMRQGDCSGMPVDGSLKGCVWRSASASFPGSG